MVFSSLTFIYAFLPVVLVLYFVIPNRIWRNCVLLVSSLLFYAWGEPKFVVVMVLSVAVAYICGLLIARYEVEGKQTAKKLWLWICVAVLVGVLFVFKYLGLFAETLNSIIGGGISLREIVLPIGISFYTFQVLSYVIDLYRGKVAVQKNFFWLLLYVCFFPQLIAGPIVRYETVEQEIRSRKENFPEFVQGLERFLFGLAKKVLLANTLARLADGVFAAGAAEAGTLLTWAAALAYTFQIYFDFSGYSDMAIGIGKMFGFHFLENFNYPYMALSVSDFWRRWHISLSSWFRDYIYIPLGGNRVGRARHIFNLLAVWALTGFWHGAEWSFLLWGLYYGVILILEKFLLQRVLDKLPKVLRWLYSFVLVVVGWIIFYNQSLADMAQILRTMFVWTAGSPLETISSITTVLPSFIVLPVAALCSFPVFKAFIRSEGLVCSVLRMGVCGVLFILCVMFLVSSGYNPFIYFRF